MYKLKKLIPFYGTWPDFMHLYVESCRRNPLIEVIFITDLAPFPGSPPNITYFDLSFDALKARITNLFGVDVSNIIPYKICDFRPAFGIIFADLIGEADFWGYGDNDLILGDVGAFITEERLESYDILSFKEGHLQGPFTFFRNNDFVNNLFRTGGEYLRIFSTPDYLSFDEFGPNVFYTSLQDSDSILTVPQDNISVIALRLAKAGSLRIFLQQFGKEDLKHKEVICYRDGVVSELTSGKEFIFYHWVLEKRALWFKYPAWLASRPTSFYISTTGFYSESEYLTYRLRHLFRLAKGALQWATLKLSNFVDRRRGRPVRLDTYPRIGWVKKLVAAEQPREESRNISLELGDTSPSPSLGIYYIDMRPALVHYTEHYFAGKFDENGVPMIMTPAGLRYFPINIAQYGFILHAQWLEGGLDSTLKVLKNCLAILESLKSTRDDTYVWLHDFYLEKYALSPPWPSGMAQGQMISFYLRMYNILGDESLLETAWGAFRFFRFDTSEGGVKRRDAEGNIWLEEYPSEPPSYVLNGFVYAVFGLYDLYRVTGSSEASSLFDECVKSLETYLPLYDTGYWSRYDLAKEELVRYYYQKNVHVPQLRVLEKLTGSRTFGKYAERWSRQLNPWNFALVRVMYRVQPRLRRLKAWLNGTAKQ